MTGITKGSFNFDEARTDVIMQSNFGFNVLGISDLLGVKISVKISN